MKIIKRNTGYAKNIFEVVLSEEEKKMTDEMLINLADGSDSNFGGKVQRLANSKAIIEVYID